MRIIISHIDKFCNLHTSLFIMHIFQLIHTIKSPRIKLKLEKHLSSISEILSFEKEVGYYYYEIQTGIRKKEFIKSLRTIVKSLFLSKEERVVLYDQRFQSEIFELPSKNEKILLNGYIEKENLVEKIILMVFKHVKMKMVLKEIENKYFSSSPEKDKP